MEKIHSVSSFSVTTIEDVVVESDNSTTEESTLPTLEPPTTSYAAFKNISMSQERTEIGRNGTYEEMFLKQFVFSIDEQETDVPFQFLYTNRSL